MEWEVESNPVLDEMDINKQVSFGKIKAQKIKKNMLIDVKNLEYKIGQTKIQKIPEFKIWEGDRVRIVGPNGRGKSTLIKLIRGVLETEKDLKTIQAEYQKETNWVETLGPKDRENYFYRYQNYALDQFVDGSINFKNLEYKQFFVFEQVSSYPSGYTLNQYLTEKTQLMPYQIKNFLKKLKLEKFSENTHLNKFSLGEYIRLQFGILGLISNQIRLLILDEPGNFLDIFTQKALIEMLAGYNGSLILITHDQVLAEKLEVDEVFEI
jgi:ATPase subunit of ABC transporter with duplicated ATPase domains